MGDGFKLSGLTGQYSGQDFPLEPGEHVVGRGEGSDLQLMDPRISRQHARLTIAPGACRIEDLGSTDGTYLNGEAIGEAELNDGDKLRFGGSVFLFHAPRAAAAGQDAIPTVLDVSTSAPTSLAGAGQAPPGLQAAPTRLSASAAAPPDPAGTVRREAAQSTTGKPAPVVAPPGPPPTAPPSQPAAPRPFPWRWLLFGAGGLAVVGVLIVLGLVLLGGRESPAAATTPAAAVFDAPTAGPTWTSQASLPSPSAAPPEAEVTEPGAVPELLPSPTSEAPAPTVMEEPVPQAVSASRQVAFASDRSGLPQIFLVSLEGGEPLQLTDRPGGACQPAWTPDGAQLAFISPCSSNREEYNGASIYVMQVGQDGALTDAAPLISTLTGGDYDPAWSPDGSRIAFTSLRTGRPQIFAAAADGSGEVNLNNDLAYNWSPAWSPDGSQLAFLSGRGGQEEIWLIPAAGGEETRFTRGDGKNVARPAWSPDGAAIVFEKVVGNIPRLIAAPLADGGLRELQVCQDGQLSLQPMGEPAWSADGRWLSFATWPAGAEHKIAVLQPGCSGYQELTGGAVDFDPAPRPSP